MSFVVVKREKENEDGWAWRWRGSGKSLGRGENAFNSKKINKKIIFFKKSAKLILV